MRFLEARGGFSESAARKKRGETASPELVSESAVSIPDRLDTFFLSEKSLRLSPALSNFFSLTHAREDAVLPTNTRR